MRAHDEGLYRKINKFIEIIIDGSEEVTKNQIMEDINLQLNRDPVSIEFLLKRGILHYISGNTPAFEGCQQ